MCIRDSAIAAHGHTGCQNILSSLRDIGEKFPPDTRKLPAYVSLVTHAVLRVRIPSQMYLRHDHRNPQLTDIALYGSSPAPCGVVIRHTVQQKHCGILSLPHCPCHTNLSSGPLGKDHRHLCAHCLLYTSFANIMYRQAVHNLCHARIGVHLYLCKMSCCHAGIFSGIGGIGIVAVSYTHLDVYKRQHGYHYLYYNVTTVNHRVFRTYKVRRRARSVKYKNREGLL